MGANFSFVADENDRAVLQRATDIISSAEKWNKPCFSNFLTEHEQAVLTSNLRGILDERHVFEGGHDNAERRIFCAFPEIFDNTKEYDDYPFKNAGGILAARRASCNA